MLLTHALIQVCESLTNQGRPPAVILTGDFNSVPGAGKYEPLTYNTIKSHPLSLRFYTTTLTPNP